MVLIRAKNRKYGGRAFDFCISTTFTTICHYQMAYSEAKKEAAAATVGPKDGRHYNYHTFPADERTLADDAVCCTDDSDDYYSNYSCRQLCRHHRHHPFRRWCHRRLRRTMAPVHLLAVFLPPALVLLLLSLALSSPVPVPWPAELGERQISAPPPNDSANTSRPADIAEYDAETWTLGTRTMLPNVYQAQPYVANGYHGSRLTAEGVGYWVCVSPLSFSFPFSFANALGTSLWYIHTAHRSEDLTRDKSGGDIGPGIWRCRRPQYKKKEIKGGCLLQQTEKKRGQRLKKTGYLKRLNSNRGKGVMITDIGRKREKAEHLEKKMKRKRRRDVAFTNKKGEEKKAKRNCKTRYQTRNKSPAGHDP